MNGNKTKAFFRILGKARKGILSVLLLCVIIFASASLAEAAEGYIEIARNDSSIYSLSVRSVEKRKHISDEYIVGWIKVFVRKPEKEKPINGKKPSYIMHLLACNPKVKQMQMLSYTYYDKDGNVIFSLPSQSFATYKYKDCIPDTMMEVTWYAIVGTYFGLYE